MKIYAIKFNDRVMYRITFKTPEKAQKMLNKLGYYADNNDWMLLFHKGNYTAYIVELELENGD